MSFATFNIINKTIFVNITLQTFYKQIFINIRRLLMRFLVNLFI